MSWMCRQEHAKEIENYLRDEASIAVQRRTDVRTLLLGYEGINGEGLLLKILVGQRGQVQ